MMDPVGTRAPAAVVPPRGLSGIFDDWDPTATLDTADFAPSQVFVNVYDLGDNETLRKINAISTGNNNLLLGGLFHASVEVYGREWCYGFTHDDSTGVSHLPPRCHPQHSYRTTVPMGCTQLSKEEVATLLDRMSNEWPGSMYHIIHNNCLSFCNALLTELGVGRLPGWIDRAQRTACFLDDTSKAVAEKTQNTVNLARSMSMEVESSVRSAANSLPAAAEIQPDEALEALREQSVKAMETAQAESAKLAEAASIRAQEIAEAAQAHAQVISSAAQAQAEALGETMEVVQAQAQELQQVAQQRVAVLGEVVQKGAQDLGNDINQVAEDLLGQEALQRAQEVTEATQQRAWAFGNSLWQWGQELQQAAARAIGEEQQVMPRQPGGGDGGAGLRAANRHAAAPKPLLCPNGHEMVLTMAQRGFCDGCGISVGGMQVSDCRRCDWYICEECRKRKQAPKQVSQPSAAPSAAPASAPNPAESAGPLSAEAQAPKAARAAASEVPPEAAAEAEEEQE